MTNGFLYCFSNSSMPGILIVGITERTPEIRLKEANSSDTWRPPTPYKIEFAKKVLNSKQKEIAIYSLLSRYTERINPKREFFRVSIDEIKMFFNMIDGELYVIEESEIYDVSEDEVPPNDCKKNSRDMTKCFINGQRIRHTIAIDKTWIGIYDSSKNGIIYDTKIYKSLSGFAGAHYSIDRPDRGKSANGWSECECEVNGIWISTYNL